jgi:ferritin-like metal-binding protein YciE
MWKARIALGDWIANQRSPPGLSTRGALMKLDSLQKLFVDELRDLHHAEARLVKALPKLVKAATSPDLRSALENHLEQTKVHVKRLDHVLETLEVSAKGKKCLAMEGMIHEAADLLDRQADPEVLDAAIIAEVQRMEHYEIAGYGCVRTYARVLGLDSLAAILQTTLDEEADEDKLLTRLAETINMDALVDSASASMARGRK